MKYYKNTTQYIIVIISAFIYALNVKVFIENAQLYPGGFSGISLLIIHILSNFFNIRFEFGYIYIVLNIITVFFVFKYIGKKFLLLSALHFILTSIFSLLIPSINITNDILLSAVFGGLINGFAISVALKNNASSGGTDLIAIYATIKYKIEIWDYIMYINAFILFLAGFFFGYEVALYSIIFQFCSTQTIKRLHVKYKIKQIIIITSRKDKITKALIENIPHGITAINSEGVYSHHQNNILLMTCTATQVDKIIYIIKKIDANAFINVINVEKISGNFYLEPMN